MNIQPNRIDTVLNQAAKMFSATQASIGSTTSFNIDGHDVSSKLYGFNGTRKGCIIELSVNNVMLERIILKKQGDMFSPATKYNYRSLYNFKKNIVSRPSLDLAN